LALRGFYHHIWSLQHNAGLEALEGAIQ